jgi:hypothetical protein
MVGGTPASALALVYHEGDCLLRRFAQNGLSAGK